MSSTKGFTLIEIVVVIAIIALISTVTLSATSRGTQQQTLDGAASTLASLLAQARADTLSSQNNLTYGVHVDAGQFVLFGGTSYVENAAGNVAVPIDTNIAVIAGYIGGADVMFRQLSGEASAYGTTTLSILSGGATITRTVVVSKSGAIGVQ